MSWPTPPTRTTFWQIPTRERSPLDTLVREALRAHLFPGEPTRTPFAPLPEGQGIWGALPDGTKVALTLATAPSTERRQGERACAGLRVTGTMATGGRGYWVEADLLLDLATRAVVQCDVQVHDTGTITGRL